MEILQRGVDLYRISMSHHIRIRWTPHAASSPTFSRLYAKTRAPTISNYMPDSKHPPSPIEIPYVPKPEYPEYLVPSDDEAPLEDQPLPVDASPTTASPGYVVDSDLKEDHANYPIDESAPTPRSPHTIIPISQTRLRRARKTVRLEPPMSASMETCIARHAALLSTPLHVASPPLPLPSPLTTGPTDTGAPLDYRAAKIRMRALLPSTSCRTDIPKADKMAPKKRTIRAIPATTTTPTTIVTDAQLQALIDRGVAAAFSERDAKRSRNGYNSNYSGTSERRQKMAPKKRTIRAIPATTTTPTTIVTDAQLQALIDRGVAAAFSEQSAKVERYIDGLIDIICGSAKASTLQSMQEAIDFATEMMDKKMLTHVERQAEHKRKFDDTSRNNQN
nr:hypothetical protein [Tanacetum cinerariifolium]